MGLHDFTASSRARVDSLTERILKVERANSVERILKAEGLPLHSASSAPPSSRRPSAAHVARRRLRLATPAAPQPPMERPLLAQSTATGKPPPGRLVKRQSSLLAVGRQVMLQSSVVENARAHAERAEKRCAEMLRQERWMNTHEVTAEGTLARLQMIRAAGLPDMKVIPASTIVELGRIPRSTEGHAINAIDAVNKHGGDEWGYSKAIIVFLSHRWKRPLWCAGLGRNVAFGSPEYFAALKAGHYVGDPDDAEHSKAAALIEWSRWFARGIAIEQIVPGVELDYSYGCHSFGTTEVSGDPSAEIFFWIDWPCARWEESARPTGGRSPTPPAWLAG